MNGVLVDRQLLTDRRHARELGRRDGDETLLSWKWAADQLRRSHNYWITTARPNGPPHAMPVLTSRPISVQVT